MSFDEDGRTAVPKAVAVMERSLADRESIAAGSFSLADIGFMPYIEYLFLCGEGSLITDHRNTASWWTRISERASWQKVRAKMQAD